MIEKLRIYHGKSFDPYYNLATEKALFDALSDNTVVLYLWQNENTVVFGNNQNPWEECRCALMKEEGIKAARRLSGGGAVFHDLGNLNFTFICAAGDFDLTRQLSVIGEALKRAGIATEFSGRNDILANGRKFSGNAFYNSGGRAYHHGTVLISADKEKMMRYLTPDSEKLKAKGVKSVSSRTINLAELCPSLTPDIMKDYMISAAEKIYGCKAEICPEPEDESVRKLEALYSDWDYIYGKTIAFSLSVSERFPWGKADLRLSVEKGVISDAVLYTDSMDHLLSDIFRDAVNGIKFEYDVLRRVITEKLDTAVAEDLLSLISRIL